MDTTEEDDHFRRRLGSSRSAALGTKIRNDARLRRVCTPHGSMGWTNLLFVKGRWKCCRCSSGRGLWGLRGKPGRRLPGDCQAPQVQVKNIHLAIPTILPPSGHLWASLVRGRISRVVAHASYTRKHAECTFRPTLQTCRHLVLFNHTPRLQADRKVRFKRYMSDVTVPGMPMAPV